MGQVLLDSFERERKNLTRAERELVRRKENARTNTAAVTSRTSEQRERTKKEKKRNAFSSVFERFEFFERFSTAGRSRFPPQNRGVGQKRKIDRSKKRRAEKKAKSVSILVRI